MLHVILSAAPSIDLGVFAVTHCGGGGGEGGDGDGGGTCFGGLRNAFRDIIVNYLTDLTLRAAGLSTILDVILSTALYVIYKSISWGVVFAITHCCGRRRCRSESWGCLCNSHCTCAKINHGRSNGCAQLASIKVFIHVRKLGSLELSNSPVESIGHRTVFCILTTF